LRKIECIKVHRRQGGDVIRALSKLDLLNVEFKIAHSEDSVLIPLKRKLTDEEERKLKSEIGFFEVSEHNFIQRHLQKNLMDVLEETFPPHLLASVPRSYDIVGHIAILELQPELSEFKRVIGNAVIQLHRNVKTVLAKISPISGEFRLRKFELVAGEDRTETEHREHGCRFLLDVKKAYFSPRLAFEHKRVAQLVREGEVIVDMFAGIGPFSVIIAKNRKNVKIYAIDLNSDAIEYLKRNIKLNNVNGKIVPIVGDAEKIISVNLRNIADRVIMNLPERAVDYVDTACKAIKLTGGIIHFYTFTTEPKPVEKAIEVLREAIEKAGRKMEEKAFARLVKPSAPHEWQVVVDVKVI
jgi:tRNA (guanine37-N1)-methyltransferase